jgi:Nitroreductase family
VAWTAARRTLEPARRRRPHSSATIISPQRLIYASGMEFTEVIKRRKMVRAFTGEPLAPGTADRLLRAAERAPSAGFSQGYSFLVLEGAGQCAPLWKILADAVDAGGGTADEDPAEVTALSLNPPIDFV